MFEDFKANYAKNYESAPELMYRFAVFKNTLEIIEARNKENNVHGVNEFSDLPNEEWRAKFLGLDTSLAMDESIPVY